MSAKTKQTEVVKKLPLTLTFFFSFARSLKKMLWFSLNFYSPNEQSIKKLKKKLFECIFTKKMKKKS